ncbi:MULTISPECIES: NUDIX domain-containing protein [unclassified Pseudomonas]|uniref:NUDIX hydrolase n=1 Tax=unclassified Pseudomonas TaxID=196821 RepID=UPI00257D728F|nr:MULTISPECIES: NUDIX domain-containing protein [unclassified Pseudomonas]
MTRLPLANNDASASPVKACPVVLRHKSELQILAFEHPLAGLQLIKGSIEPGELPAEAALRELWEESGIQVPEWPVDLGTWISGYQEQVWSMHLCESAYELPEGWAHRTTDGGGLEFRFFWYPLGRAASSQWHWVFREVLKVIHDRVRRMG